MKNTGESGASPASGITESAAWRTFAERMAEIRDLGAVVSVLAWDQETFMPAKGTASRAEQLATLQGILHARTVDPSLADALAALEARGSDLTNEQKAMVREMRFERDRAAKLPQDLVREIARLQSIALEAWRYAREHNDFARFAPPLTRLVELRRRAADAYGVPANGERYDALLEGYEPGMRVARLSPLFDKLTGWLAPAVAALTSAPSARGSDVLEGRKFDSEKQWAFTLELLSAMGFDTTAGRQDQSTHPFTSGFDPGDVRITTRIFEDLPLSSVFSTIHEAGHALYEQGLPAEHRRTILCSAPSMGLHESQSRLWENQVGRSRPFWQAFLPRYRALFPTELAGVELDAFYRAINRVLCTPIRVESDEVTYNLHIVARYRLELAMMRGDLSVADLPGAWNEMYRNLLGIVPESNAKGVLQDIHWAWGELGYFPTYTIGNLYAASLFDTVRRDLDGLEEHIAKGELGPLREWLRARIHRLGRLHQAEEIVTNATGHGLSVDAFVSYLRAKYEPLYGVTLPKAPSA
jgi:carboxypeptidase Taq